MAEYNNDFNNVTINTQIITLWDSVTGSQLRVGGNGSGLSIAIWLPHVEDNGSRKYPASMRHSVLLKSNVLETFNQQILHIFNPRYVEGNNIRVGIHTSKTSIIELEAFEGNIFFHMHKDCDAVTKKPINTYTFKFGTVDGLEGYNPSTGEGNLVPYQGDFYVFMKALVEFGNSIGGMIAGHGVRNANAYFTKENIGYRNAIATAVNAQLPISDNGYSNNYARTLPTPNPNLNQPAVAMNQVTDFEQMMQ